MATLVRSEPIEVEVTPTLAAQVDGQCGPGMEGLSAAMTTAFETLGAYLHQHEIAPVGPPRAVYTVSSPEGSRFIVGFPVAAPPAGEPEPGPVRVGELPGGKMLRFTHRGPYAQLAVTYGAITEWLKQRGMLASEADWDRYMPMWEEYPSDPGTTPPEELLTYIYIPVGG